MEIATGLYMWKYLTSASLIVTNEYRSIWTRAVVRSIRVETIMTAAVNILCTFVNIYIEDRRHVLKTKGT